MNKAERGAIVLLTVLLSSMLAGYLLVLTKHGHSLSDSLQRDARDYNDDNWSSEATYIGTVYPSPTPEPDSTCQALEQLASTSTGACSTNSQCNGVHCTVGLGSFDMVLEPCHNPPAIQLVGRDLTDNVVFNDTLTNSRQEDILGVGTLNIDIQQSLTEDSISIKIDAVIAGTTIPIIPQTSIPLNRAQCDFVPQTITPSHPTTSISPTPSPTPNVDLTCQALEQIASSSLLCSTSEQCRGVTCDVPTIGSIGMTVEPCHNPPAIYIVGRDSSGNVVLNDTITKSRDEDIPGVATIHVKLEQSPNEDSITMSVDVTPALTGTKVNLIPETTIPLNREQCGFTAHPLTPTPSHLTTSVTVMLTSTPSHITSSYPPTLVSSITTSSLVISASSTVVRPVTPTKPSAGADSSTTIAVAIPVVTILCLMGAVVLAVAIAIAIRRRRQQRREFQFQRVTFADDQDDDEDL